MHPNWQSSLPSVNTYRIEPRSGQVVRAREGRSGAPDVQLILKGLVVGPGRLELPTLCLEGRCSIHLSYGPVSLSVTRSTWRSGAACRRPSGCGRAGFKGSSASLRPLFIGGGERGSTLAYNPSFPSSRPFSRAAHMTMSVPALARAFTCGPDPVRLPAACRYRARRRDRHGLNRSVHQLRFGPKAWCEVEPWVEHWRTARDAAEQSKSYEDCKQNLVLPQLSRQITDDGSDSGSLGDPEGAGVRKPCYGWSAMASCGDR